jgi:hypothetical protein
VRFLTYPIAALFKHFLLAKLVYDVTCLASPQSAEPQALAGWQ